MEEAQLPVSMKRAGLHRCWRVGYIHIYIYIYSLCWECTNAYGVDV